MNWETGEEDGSGWAGHAPGRDPEEIAFNEGVKSVLSIRCMEHREVPEINLSTGHSECGECIRQQCWKDMLGLVKSLVPDSTHFEMLYRSLIEQGVGTFGVPDEREKGFAARLAEVSKPAP